MRKSIDSFPAIKYTKIDCNSSANNYNTIESQLKIDPLPKAFRSSLHYNKEFIKSLNSNGNSSETTFRLIHDKYFVELKSYSEDAVFILDAKGKVLATNTEASGLFTNYNFITESHNILEFINTVEGVILNKKDLANKFLNPIENSIIKKIELIGTEESDGFCYIQNFTNPFLTNQEPLYLFVIMNDSNPTLIDIRYQNMESNIVHLLNTAENFQTLVNKISEIIYDLTDVEAIGIRFKQSNDFPYFTSTGFSDDFLKSENSLLPSNSKRKRHSVVNLECMCGAVLQGRTNPELPEFTQHGSFWTNGTSAMLKKYSESDFGTKTRNICNLNGYESVALIPIKFKEVTYGLIQLNDTRKNIFTKKMIMQVEKLSENIALSLLAKSREEELIYKTKKLKYQNLFLENIHEFTNTLKREDLSRESLIAKLFEILQQVSLYQDLMNVKLRFRSKEYISQQLKNYSLKQKITFFSLGKKIGSIEYYFDKESPEYADKEYQKELKSFLESVNVTLEEYIQQKELEYVKCQSELKFNSIWQNSTDGMRLTNNKGIIIGVNDIYCKSIGIDANDLLGKPAKDVYHKSCKSVERKLFSKKDLNYDDFINIDECEVLLKNNKNIFFDIHYSVINKESRNSLLLGIFHNITPQIEIKKEMKNIENLAAIGKLTSYMNHEIKSYLNPIKMNLDYLKARINLDDSESRQFDMMLKQVDRLETLVREALEYSRNNRINYAWINLSQLLESLILFFKNVSHKNKIQIVNSIDPNISIHSDFEKIQCVFIHLLQNSFEAITQNGMIEIYSSKNNKGKYFSIFIKDDGPGIKNPEKIFQIFHTTKPNGTGLGLSLIKKYLELFKANIVLADNRCGNTIFEIKYPLKAVRYGNNTNN